MPCTAGAPVRRTGFQRHVQCCAPDRSLGVPQGLDFGMEVSRAPVPASRENLSAGNNKRADGGIRMCATGALSSLANGLAHELFVGFHLVQRLALCKLDSRGNSSRWPES